MNKNKALLSIISIQLITGTTYLVAKIGLEELHPMVLAMLRFILTTVLFTIILYITNNLQLPEKKDLVLFVRMAILCIPINQGLFLYGIKETLSSHGALLYALTPIFVLFIGHLSGIDRVNIRKIIGVVLAFLGVAVVLLQKGLKFSFTNLKGDFIVLLAVLAWSLYVLDQKKAVKKYSPIFVTGISMILGTVIFAPIGLYHCLNINFTYLSWKSWFSVAYLSIFTSVIAYIVWAWALTKLGTVQVSVVSNLQPIIAAIAGWIILKEEIGIYFVFGTLLVIVGVYIVQTSNDEIITFNRAIEK